MQTITKSLIFLCVSISLLSCKKDADDTPADIVIGKWSLEQSYYNGVASTMTECEKGTTIEFKEDGTFSAIDKEQEEEDGACFEGVFSGTWENLNENNNYRFKIEGEEGDPDYYFNNAITLSGGNLLLVFKGEDFEGENFETKDEYNKV